MSNSCLLFVSLSYAASTTNIPVSPKSPFELYSPLHQWTQEDTRIFTASGKLFAAANMFICYLMHTSRFSCIDLVDLMITASLYQHRGSLVCNAFVFSGPKDSYYYQEFWWVLYLGVILLVSNVWVLLESLDSMSYGYSNILSTEYKGDMAMSWKQWYCVVIFTRIVTHTFIFDIIIFVVTNIIYIVYASHFSCCVQRYIFLLTIHTIAMIVHQIHLSLDLQEAKEIKCFGVKVQLVVLFILIFVHRWLLSLLNHYYFLHIIYILLLE